MKRKLALSVTSLTLLLTAACSSTSDSPSYEELAKQATSKGFSVLKNANIDLTGEDASVPTYGVGILIGKCKGFYGYSRGYILQVNVNGKMSDPLVGTLEEIKHTAPYDTACF
ncbi:MAG TPA: hypothetical protein VFT59_05875 [Candidatus Saccharimonadales bacterium]|nr:hypothetical protein [Candidatus Saccharimonadales bacterium]